jgi:hypothetical protein
MLYTSSTLLLTRLILKLLTPRSILSSTGLILILTTDWAAFLSTSTLATKTDETAPTSRATTTDGTATSIYQNRALLCCPLPEVLFKLELLPICLATYYLSLSLLTWSLVYSYCLSVHLSRILVWNQCYQQCYPLHETLLTRFEPIRLGPILGTRAALLLLIP